MVILSKETSDYLLTILEHYSHILHGCCAECYTKYGHDKDCKTWQSACELEKAIKNAPKD